MPRSFWKLLRGWHTAWFLGHLPLGRQEERLEESGLLGGLVCRSHLGKVISPQENHCGQALAVQMVLLSGCVTNMESCISSAVIPSNKSDPGGLTGLVTCALWT